jgi:hypothetical protein
MGIVPYVSYANKRYIAAEDQYVLVHEKVTTFNDERIASEEFEKLLQRAIRPHVMGELAASLVATLNLHTANGAAEVGENWHAIEPSISEGIWTAREGQTRPHVHLLDNRQSWIPSTQSDAFLELWRAVSDSSVWRKLQIPMGRFSESRSRNTDHEAIVDLAIAAEALFGPKSGGESTFRVSLNAALLLASNGEAGPAARRTFAELYGMRSAIVHGADVSKKSEEFHRIANEASEAMRKALRIAAIELNRDPNALDWTDRLDRFLREMGQIDARQEPAE